MAAGINEFGEQGWVGGWTGGKQREFNWAVNWSNYLFTCSYIIFYFFSCSKEQPPCPGCQKRPASKHSHISFFSLPPPSVSVADKAPVDSRCSAGCSICGWSGCADSEAAAAPPRSRRHCGPWSSGNHTAGSCSWSQLPLGRCCLDHLRVKTKKTCQSLIKKNNRCRV